METFAIRSLDFTYPNMKKKALDNIDLCINEGEFVAENQDVERVH